MSGTYETRGNHRGSGLWNVDQVDKSYDPKRVLLDDERCHGGGSADGVLSFVESVFRRVAVCTGQWP